jgi:hypothetical protein
MTLRAAAVSNCEHVARVTVTFRPADDGAVADDRYSESMARRPFAAFRDAPTSIEETHRMLVLATVFAFAGFTPQASATGEGRRPSAGYSYDLVDVGLPSKIGPLNQPIALNNTGQIVGTVIDEANLVTHCVAWTGTEMIDFGNAESLGCYPSSGITDADSTGTFKIVGKTAIPQESGDIAFLATVGRKSLALKLYTNNVPSWLFAMNASGYAAGTAQWSPVGGFASSSPAWTTTGGNLALLQPACTVASATCMGQPYYWNFAGASRSINAAGTILGNPTGFISWPTLIEYNASNPKLSHAFTLPTVNGAKPNYSVGIDDAGLVYYTANLTAFKSQLFRYNPVTKAATFLGYVAGDTACSMQFVAVNKYGEALLHAGSCGTAANNGYWTWTAAHGFGQVTAANAKLYPIISMTNINDKGQILASLTTASYTHWGYFTPI